MKVEEFAKKIVLIPTEHRDDSGVLVIGDYYEEEVIVEILKGGNLEKIESLTFAAYPLEADKDSERLCEMLECHFFKVRLLNHFPKNTEILERYLENGDVDGIREFLQDEYDSSEFMRGLISDVDTFGAYFSKDSIEIPTGD